MPDYVFKGRGNYGGNVSTPEEWKAAFEAAPACHNLGHSGLKRVALDDLGSEERAEIIANDAADMIDRDWAGLNGLN